MPESRHGNRPAELWRRYRLVLLLVVLVSVLHYNTAIHIHSLHGIYRRLYYFPIIMAAFRGGLRGGLSTALLVITLYIPHALGSVGYDPGAPMEKVLEMVLYVAVGVLTGSQRDRIKAVHERLGHAVRDLTSALDENKRMEAEMVRTARLATVGRLSAGLAHEIRNPLASIQGSAEVLGDEFPEGHSKSGLARILLQETHRLNEVLTRFLAFARSEPGECATFDLTAEVRIVADLLRHRPEGEGVAITLEAEDVPPAFGNSEWSRQVLLNLGLNALQEAGKGGEVVLSVRTNPGEVRCEVRDTGPGFDAEALANFGTPFYSTRSGGTGLGLATSLRLAEDMGGRLEARNGPGGCVTFGLPAAGRE